MELKLSKSVVKGVYVTSGPQVLFELGDTGQANVMVNAALSDGTHFQFPDGSGVQTSRTTVLPPGDYNCAIVVAAFSHGAFGSSYNTSVSIGGKQVATATGDVADGSDEEDAVRSFVLRITKE
jgi:hypothetical protein